MPGREPPVSLLITAEHASNAIPSRWLGLFDEDLDVLDTHRAWDPGSLALARALAGRLAAPLMKGKWSRLLVDLNRSEHHPRRFSEFSRGLSPDERAELTESIWRPHWAAYAEFVCNAPGRVIHLACHSFTPVLDGTTRPTDIGLLHDPSRLKEDAFCKRLQKAIRAELPELAVHRNRPYKGTSDGLGSWHRKRFDDGRLTTLEIELNQRFASGPDAVQVRESLVRAVQRVVGER
ncbi:N-formylglutamate amidohydrolase [Halomonas denitrificans]|nr:N-formylglutamate amidohydrolase [Halomonas denitrificans]